MTLRVFAVLGLGLPLLLIGGVGVGATSAPKPADEAAPAPQKRLDRQWPYQARPLPTRLYTQLGGKDPVVLPPAVPERVPMVVVPPVIDCNKAAPRDVTLSIRRSTSGRIFDDNCGRRWILVYGSPLWGGPNELRGWMLDLDSDVPHLFTRSGRLFRLQFAR